MTDEEVAEALTAAITAEREAGKNLAAAREALEAASAHRRRCETAAATRTQANLETAAHELAKAAPGPSLRLLSLARRGLTTWAFSRKVFAVSIEEIVSNTIFLGRFAEIDGNTARWSEQRRVSCVSSGLSRDQIGAWIKLARPVSP